MGFDFNPLVQGNCGFMFICSVMLLLFRLIFAELYRLRKGGERLARVLYKLQGEHETIHKTPGEETEAAKTEAAHGQHCVKNSGDCIK